MSDLDAASTVTKLVRELRENPMALESMLAEIAAATEKHDTTKTVAEEASRQAGIKRRELKDYEDQLDAKAADLVSRIAAHEKAKEVLSVERGGFDRQKTQLAAERSEHGNQLAAMATREGAVKRDSANLAKLIQENTELKSDLQRRLNLMKAASV